MALTPTAVKQQLKPMGRHVGAAQPEGQHMQSVQPHIGTSARLCARNTTLKRLRIKEPYESPFTLLMLQLDNRQAIAD